MEWTTSLAVGWCAGIWTVYMLRTLERMAAKKVTPPESTNAAPSPHGPYFGALAANVLVHKTGRGFNFTAWVIPVQGAPFAVSKAAEDAYWVRVGTDERIEQGTYLHYRLSGAAANAVVVYALDYRAHGKKPDLGAEA